jgi:hypothetical protein
VLPRQLRAPAAGEGGRSVALGGYRREIARYLELRRAVDLHEVTHGSRTLTLHAEDELADAQLGYGVDADGNDLSGTGAGEWQPAWLVVAGDDGGDDPIFVDLGVAGPPVLTATHAGGEWHTDLVAESFESFVAALRLVADAPGPLSDEELDDLLGRIHRLGPDASLVYWEDWLTPSPE